MFWLYLAFIICGLIILIVVFGFLSPRYTFMERSITINSNPEKAFEQLNSLQNFVINVSPWTKLDPNLEQKFKGPETGAGSHYSWEGDRKKVGKGTMEIISVDANRKVVSRLVFHGRGEADIAFTINEIGDGVITVTWDFKSDNRNNPLARIFGRMMDKFIGPDYEKGLANLKNHLEKKQSF